MANNKVIDKEGNVLLDLTGDDVVESDVMSGKKFHSRDGVQKTGTYTPPVLTDPLSEAWEAFKRGNPSNWSYAFYGAYNSAPVMNMLPSVSQLSFVESNIVTNMQYMFCNCAKITSVPLFNTSNVTNMAYMFSTCYLLTSIPAFDASKVTSLNRIFNSCSNLTEIHMTGMKVDFDISASSLFTESALVEILNNLATVDSTKTLTMGSTNLAKLTAEEKAIATNKGWTLA